MKILLLTIEFITAVSLIATILMHSAKGEGLGGIGGQARVFGAQKGLEDGLNRVTKVLAIIFVGTAAVLSIYF